jgi:transposase
VLVIFVSVLSDIKRCLKTPRDPVVRERLLMVQAACELPLREAAGKFGCTHGKVDFWKKRFEEFGIRGLRTKQHPGRPRKISEEEERVIKKTVSKKNLTNGWRTVHVRELITKKTAVEYTTRHTIRILQRWGLARITPLMRYAHSKQEDRVAFLKKTRPTWHASKNLGEL